MELFIHNVISFLLQTAWAVHLFFDKFHPIQRCDDPHSTDAQKNTTTNKETNISRISSNLLLNLNKDSFLDLSDIITPMEEEMLRCLCAKGYTRKHKRKKLDTIREVCISRDTFTNIWIDSCTV